MVKRKHKKQILCALILLSFGLTNLQAQNAIVATGGNASGSGGSVNYSIGQLVYTTNSGTTGTVAQGVQQAYEIYDVTEIEENKANKLILSVYPNPTTDYLTLKIDAGSLKSKYTAYLYDIKGNLLESKIILRNESTISMVNYLSATYFLKVVEENKNTQPGILMFKIIKN